MHFEFLASNTVKMKVFIQIPGTIVIRTRKMVWSGNKVVSVNIFVELELKYFGWPYREYIKTAKNGSFCEELLNGRFFEVILVNFCCYDFGANASED